MSELTRAQMTPILQNRQKPPESIDASLNAKASARTGSRFGHDFSQVRVHNDARFVESAQGGGENPGSPMRILQRSANGSVPATEAPPVVHDVLRFPGQPLDPSTRAYMEPRFGHDFSMVRVHADAQAAESAQAVDALAYTVGRDIVFGTGQYAPQVGKGQRLLAHELTHVVQQSRQGQAAQANLTLSEASDVSEQEADQAAERIVSGGSPQRVGVEAEHALIQRDKAPQQQASQQTEDPALRQRRLQALGVLNKSIGLMRSALSCALRWEFEHIPPGAKANRIGLGSGVMESFQNRQNRLTLLLDDMVQFTTVLASGPVPAKWLDLQVNMPAGTFEGVSVNLSSQQSFGYGADWDDLLRFFANWQLAQGQDAGVLTVNILYIPEHPLPILVPELSDIAVVKVQGYDNGIETDTRIIVPNPDTKPLEYEVLGMAPYAKNYLGQIFRVWVERGEKYYYLYNRCKRYLPERPAPPPFNPRK